VVGRRQKLVVGALALSMLSVAAPATALEDDDPTGAAPTEHDTAPASRGSKGGPLVPPAFDDSSGTPAGPDDPLEPEAVPGELIVAPDAGAGPDAAEDAVDAAGAQVVARGASDTALVEVAPGGEAEVTARLEADPRISYVEPNLQRRIDWTPNDPRYASQRGYLESMRVPRAWNRARGNGVTVAVLDTGVDARHPDLRNNLIAAITLVGGNPGDPIGHGTAMAGTIAATANNRIGIAGVAPRAKLLSIKVLGRSGGSDHDIALGVDYAVALGADIINMSLGGPGLSRTLREAIERAHRAGVLIVGSAGNEGSASLNYPAAHPDVLSVGAVTSTGDLAFFSNHGRTIDLTAPGVNVRSTLPGRSYGPGSGTSPAAAIVSGVAALVKSTRPNASPDRIATILTRNARDRGAPGWDPAFGHGVVDAAAAVGVAPRRGVSRPRPRAGDRDDDPSGAVPITGSSATGKIDVEYDEDWYSVEVAAPRDLRIRVTPPRSSGWLRMDPILVVYDSRLRFLAYADSDFEGGPETVSVRVPAGKVYVRVLNYVGSKSGEYTVTVGRSPLSGDYTRARARHAYWATRITPAKRATTMAGRPTIRATLAPGMRVADRAKLRAQLVHGRTGARLPADVALDPGNRTLTVAARTWIGRSTPVRLLVSYQTDSGPELIDMVHLATRP
jgi:serine protease